MFVPEVLWKLIAAGFEKTEAAQHIFFGQHIGQHFGQPGHWPAWQTAGNRYKKSDQPVATGYCHSCFQTRSRHAYCGKSCRSIYGLVSTHRFGTGAPLPYSEYREFMRLVERTHLLGSVTDFVHSGPLGFNRLTAVNTATTKENTNANNRSNEPKRRRW